MVVTEFFCIPALKGVALEYVSLNSGLSVAPVSIPLQKRQELGGLKGAP